MKLDYKELVQQSKNPIPEMLKFYTKAIKVFGYEVIPFAGETFERGLAHMNFLYDLYIGSYIARGAIKFIQDSVFYSEYTYDGITEDGLIDLGLSQNDVKKILVQRELYLRIFGFFPLLILKTTINGQTNFSYQTLDPRTVAVGTRENEGYIVYNPTFPLSKFERKYTQLFNSTTFETALFEDVSSAEENEEFTEYVCFIDKDENALNQVYGDSLTCIPAQFVDAAKTSMTTKMSSRELTARYIMLLESPQSIGQIGAFSEDGDNSNPLLELQESIKTSITNASTNPNALGFLQYPNGTKEPKIEKLDVTTDVKYLQYTTEKIVRDIYNTQGIDPLLSGLIEQTSGLSNGMNMKIGALYSLEVLTLPKIRSSASNFINTVVNLVTRDVESDENKFDVTVNFGSPIMDLITKINGIDSKPTTNNTIEI